jgi:hypothetical protein
MTRAAPCCGLDARNKLTGNRRPRTSGASRAVRSCQRACISKRRRSGITLAQARTACDQTWRRIYGRPHEPPEDVNKFTPKLRSTLLAGTRLWSRRKDSFRTTGSHFPMWRYASLKCRSWTSKPANIDSTRFSSRYDADSVTVIHPKAAGGQVSGPINSRNRPRHWQKWVFDPQIRPHHFPALPPH